MNLGDRIGAILLILVVVIAFATTGAGMYRTSKQTDVFIEVCKDHKGTPVFNGRNWECIKP